MELGVGLWRKVLVDKFYYFFRRSQRKAKPLKKTEEGLKKKRKTLWGICSAQVSYIFVSSPSTGTIVFPKMDEIQLEVDAKTFQILYTTVLLLLNLDWWRLLLLLLLAASLSKKYFPIFTVGSKQEERKKKKNTGLRVVLGRAASNVRLIAGKEKM